MTEQFDQKLMTFLLLIQEKITKQFEDTHRDTLTTSQFFAVALINDAGGMSMSVLAKKMGIRKQQATKVANQLAQKGFIRRDFDQADRRITRVELTPKAQEYMASYMIENIKHMSQRFALLEEGEFAQLQDAIDTINRILSQIAVEKKK